MTYMGRGGFKPRSRMVYIDATEDNAHDVKLGRVFV